MRDVKNYRQHEPMSREAIGVLSFIAGVMLVLIIEMAVR